MEEAWKKALKELKRELPEQFFEPFLQSLSIVPSDKNENLLLGVKDRNLVSHIKDRYGLVIQTKLRSLMGSNITVDFTYISSSPTDDESLKNEFIAKNTPAWINPSFRFKNFLTGFSNELAVEAVKTSALSPGTNNPLFIYGETGLGKTHLVHAAACLLQENHPENKILYITLQEFKELFLDQLSKNKSIELKKYLKTYNALILEDVQFLTKSSGSTQEEIQHTFDYFYDNGFQIILSADRFITDLNISQRLKSRFLSGLPVRIEPPDSRMRMEYIQKRNKEMNLGLSEDSLQLLGTHITQNFRLLDSALNLVEFLKSRKLNINDSTLLKKHLSGLFQQKLTITPDHIIDYISERFHIKKEEILGKSRRAEITLPRHLSMFLSLKLTNFNKSALARFFNKSDHTIIINAEKKISALQKKDINFSILIDECVDFLRKNCG